MICVKKILAGCSERQMKMRFSTNHNPMLLRDAGFLPDKIEWSNGHIQNDERNSICSLLGLEIHQEGCLSPFKQSTT